METKQNTEPEHIYCYNNPPREQDSQNVSMHLRPQ